MCKIQGVRWDLQLPKHTTQVIYELLNYTIAKIAQEPSNYLVQLIMRQVALLVTDGLTGGKKLHKVTGFYLSLTDDKTASHPL